MGKYAYTAIDADGHTVKGKLSSDTAAGARLTLLDRDLQPIGVAEKKSILQFEITRKKVSRKDLMHFSRQMAVFIRAGIPILDALEIIGEETPDKLFRKALTEMSEALRSGETFASAAELHPEAFSAFYVNILHSAELTGKLDTVLDQLGEYVERDIEARKRIVSAMVYPMIVVVMALVTATILTIYVMPKFENFFKSLNAKLPLPTRMLLSVSRFLTHNYPYLGIGLLLIITGGWLAARTRRGRMIYDTVVLRVPVLGDLIRHAILERLCRILSSMAGAGVPLPEAMAVAADATNNAVYRTGLHEVREAMMRGEGLAVPLAASGLLSGAARQMVKVGEETGTLDEQLHSAAVYFDRELDYKIKNFTSMFEPLTILVVGLIVGFVAIALVSAMYGIYRQVKT